MNEKIEDLALKVKRIDDVLACLYTATVFVNDERTDASIRLGRAKVEASQRASVGVEPKGTHPKRRPRSDELGSQDTQKSDKLGETL